MNKVNKVKGVSLPLDVWNHENNLIFIIDL